MNTILKTGQTVEEAINKGLDELGITRDQATIEVIQEESSGFLGLIGKKDAVVRIGRSQTEDISSFVRDILYDEPEDEQIEPESKPESKKTKKVIKSESKPETKTEDLSQPQAKAEEKPSEDKEETQEKPQKSQASKEKEADKRELWDNEKVQEVAKEFIGSIIDEMDFEYSVETNIFDNILNIDIDAKDQSNLGLVIGNRGSTLDAMQYLVSLILNNHREEYLRVVVDANDYRAGRMDTIRSMARKGADRVFKTGRDYKMDYMNPAERRIVHMTLQDYEYIKTKSEGREPRRRVVIYKDN